MEVILLRHGETAGNLAGRYIGRTDEPLDEAARRRLREAGPVDGVAAVLVSPLQRAVETARLLFPGAALAVCRDLREIDFGDFEGRTAQEMAADPAYREWVSGGCTGTCPRGESLESFMERTCAAFDLAVRKSIAQKEERLILVAHGGSIMAIMSRYAKPPRPFFEWHIKHCCGYRASLDPGRWIAAPSLQNYCRWELFRR
jgi:alpha-ribazole phosphatase